MSRQVGTRILAVAVAVVVLGGLTALLATLLMKLGYDAVTIVAWCLGCAVVGFALAWLRYKWAIYRKSRRTVLEDPEYPRPVTDSDYGTLMLWALALTVLVVVLDRFTGAKWWAFALYCSTMAGFIVGASVFLTPGRLFGGRR